MVQSLPGFLNLCLNVCSPSQVLGDVYTEVLEAATLAPPFKISVRYCEILYVHRVLSLQMR